MNQKYRQRVKLFRQCAASVKQLPQGEQLPRSKPGAERSPKADKTMGDLDKSLETFLQRTYDLRYNLLTDETEFRPCGRAELPFQPIGQRELNTMCMDAHAAGVSCWDRDLNRYIYSTRIRPYHPFRLYMDELPPWDGRDRVRELAARVSHEPLWVDSFHIWMRAMAAQWMGLSGVHANSVAPMLVSREQGRLKSTFCKMLLPGLLERYYTDSLNLTGQGQPERRLAEAGLINLDEFDKYPAKKMPVLKNLMQMAALNLRKAHQKNFRLLPRIASFIGTSNRMDLLTDPTGSRRFICIEVRRKIDCTEPDHAQLYAQLKAELTKGARHWFTAGEEEAIQVHNALFSSQSPGEEVLRACYRPAEEGEECLLLSAADLFQAVKKKNGAAMQGANPGQFSQVLTAVGMKRKHTKRGNVYPVVKVV